MKNIFNAVKVCCLLLIISVVMCSCVRFRFITPTYIPKQTVYSGSDVQFGMTKEEFVAIKGEPTKITPERDGDGENYIYIDQINGRQAIYTYFFYKGGRAFYEEAVLFRVEVEVLTHPDERQVIFKDARNALLADYSKREGYFIDEDSETKVVFGTTESDGIYIRIIDDEQLSKISIIMTGSDLYRTYSSYFSNEA